MDRPEPGENVVTESDIVFDCPHCGKSLTIDQRGAGMMVRCPDCQASVQVPGIADLQEFASDRAADEAILAPARAGAGNLEHYQAIAKEIGLIQAALDRIVGILQDAEAENAGR